MQDCLGISKAEQSQLFDHNSSLTFLEELNSAVNEGPTLSANPNIVCANQYQQKHEFHADLAHSLSYQHQFQMQEQDQLVDAHKKSGGQNVYDKLTALPNTSINKASYKPTKKLNHSKPQSEAILSKPSPQKRAAAFEIKRFNLTPSKRHNRDAYGNDENITPSPPTTSHRASSPARSAYTSRSHTNPRSVVNFSISPGGRAKVETTILPEPPSEHEMESEECDSDSSTDIDELIASSFANRNSRSNNGSQYVTSSRTSIDGDKDAALRTTPKRPQLARFNTTPVTAHLSKSASNSERKPSVARPPSRSQTSPSTSNSLPMIPQPIKNLLNCQKPTSTNRRKKSNNPSQSVPSSKSLHSSRSLCSMREESDHSEAETVVDEHDTHSRGDAIQALRRAIKRRRSNIRGILLL